MAYEEVTSPILTDATGQEIVDKLDAIAQAVQPPTNIEASDVSYDNTQSGMTATDVQDAVTELKSNLTDLEYTLVGVKYGNVAMNLPANWKELVIYFRYGNSSGLQAQVIQGSLLRLHTQNTNFTYAVGSGTISAQFTVNTNDNTITMVYFAVGTTAFTATSQMTVYARN